MSVPDTSSWRSRTHLFVRDLQWYDERAHGLLAVLPDGAPAVLEQVRVWHPDFAGASDDVIRSASLTIDDTRLVYAREHGFDSWSLLVERLRQLEAGADAEPFMAVFEAGKHGDWRRAQELLRTHPDLARARGSNGNTLLNLACSLLRCPDPDQPASSTGNGDEPDRLLAVRLLLAAHADPNQANDRGWTPLHQAAARDDVEMASLLLAAGARVDREAHGDGGTPLAVALFGGKRDVSELLASVAVVPANLRVSAGLGRADLVRRCFTPDGALTAEACAKRAFYRPHSGFPAWHPSNDRQQVLDEALVWAAKSGRVELLPLLVERGARVSSDPYRGTSLIWAAANGRVDAVRWLVEHGADVNQRATFGGPQHGEGVTALHLAAQNDRVEIVRLLVSLGADMTIRDALYDSTPAGWAEHDGAAKVSAYFADRLA